MRAIPRLLSTLLVVLCTSLCCVNSVENLEGPYRALQPPHPSSRGLYGIVQRWWHAHQQQALDNAIARLSIQEAKELAQWEAWNAYNSTTSWQSRNSSQRIPLVPQPISWLLYEAEQEMGNTSSGGTPFDVDKTVTLARYTSVVYCNESNIWQWNCTRCRQAGSMTVYGVVFDPVWDLKAYAGYSRTLGAKMIVFRGTDSHSLYNWVENMRYWRTDVSLPFPNATGVLVHTGFLASYNMSTLRNNLTDAMVKLNQWHPFAPLYVVGHSLGGALASLCALDMKFTFGLRDVRVYTFGSPRVGNAQFAEYFDHHVPEAFRMTHNRDIVPSVPLQLMGFHHVPREVWQVDFGPHSALTVCDEGGEDARCHDSMCYLGLCTSVTDHLTYMGAHMYHSDAGC